MFQEQLTKALSVDNQAYVEQLFKYQFPSLFIKGVIPFYSKGVDLQTEEGVYYYGYLYNADTGDAEGEAGILHHKGATILKLFQNALFRYEFTGWKITSSGSTNPGIVYPEPPPPDPSDLQKLTLINHFWINESSDYYFPDGAALYLLYRSEYIDDVMITVDDDINVAPFVGPEIVEGGYMFFKLEHPDTKQFIGYDVESGTGDINKTYEPNTPELFHHNVPFIYRLEARFTFPGNPEFRYEVSHLDASGDIIPGSTDVLEPTVTYYNADKGPMIGVTGFHVRCTKNLGDKIFHFDFKVPF